MIVWNSSAIKSIRFRSRVGSRSCSRSTDSTRLTIEPPRIEATAFPIVPAAVDTKSTSPLVKTSERTMVDSRCPSTTEAYCDLA